MSRSALPFAIFFLTLAVVALWKQMSRATSSWPLILVVAFASFAAGAHVMRYVSARRASTVPVVAPPPR